MQNWLVDLLCLRVWCSNDSLFFKCLVQQWLIVFWVFGAAMTHCFLSVWCSNYSLFSVFVLCSNDSVYGKSIMHFLCFVQRWLIAFAYSFIIHCFMFMVHKWLVVFVDLVQQWLFALCLWCINDLLFFCFWCSNYSLFLYVWLIVINDNVVCMQNILNLLNYNQFG